MPIKYPCGICSKAVAKTHDAIFCDLCLSWIHTKCNNTSKNQYNAMIFDDGSSWFCQKRYNDEAPFGSISDENLKLTLQGKNTDNFSLLRLNQSINESVEFFRGIDSALNTIETELETETTCPYLSLSELNKLQSNHLNIASLDLHKPELDSLLQTCA